MIAFKSSDILKNCHGCEAGDRIAPGSLNFILSIKSNGAYCVSKILMTSPGLPRQLTLMLVLDSQADIAAIPELFSSVYIPWRSANRITETAYAFKNSGLCEKIACCIAITVDIIYDMIDRDYIDYSGTVKDCVFTSSGAMELNDECKDRIFAGEHVLCDFPLTAGMPACPDENDGIPF